MIFGDLRLKLYPGLALLIQDTQGQGGGGDQEQKHQEEVNPLDQTNIKRVKITIINKYNLLDLSLPPKPSFHLLMINIIRIKVIFGLVTDANNSINVLCSS